MRRCSGKLPDDGEWLTGASGWKDYLREALPPR